MYDQPDAAALLKIARDTFLQDLLPELPAAKRYTGLMLANALAIAGREVGAGIGALQEELTRLSGLYPDDEGCEDDMLLNDRLMNYNRRLASEIRSARLTGAREGLVRAHLKATAKAKVAVSNPKVLKSSGARE